MASSEYRVPSKSGGPDHVVKVTTHLEQAGTYVLTYLCDCKGFEQRRKCSHGDNLLKGLDPMTKHRVETVTKTLTRSDIRPLPMLAKELTAKIKITPGRFTAEPKYDGIRVVVRKEDKVFDSWSRSGNSANHRFDAVTVSQVLRLPNGIYDGELVVPGVGSYSSDATTLSNAGKLVYVVFDILELLGKDTTQMKQRDRKQLIDEGLKLVVTGSQLTRVQLSPSRQVNSLEEIDAYATELWDAGMEGIMVKDGEATYHPGKRTTAFYKLKEKDDENVRILGFTESQGEIVDRGKFACVVVQDHKHPHILSVVKTKNDAWLEKLEKEFGKREATYAEVRIGPRKVKFITNHPRCGQELKIEFQRRTPDMSYRHPRWKAVQEEF